MILIRKLIEEVSQEFIMSIQSRIDRAILSGEQEVRNIPCSNQDQYLSLVTGRGRLYYWGPNHAGDPVVTR